MSNYCRLDDQELSNNWHLRYEDTPCLIRHTFNEHDQVHDQDNGHRQGQDHNHDPGQRSMVMVHAQFT